MARSLLPLLLLLLLPGPAAAGTAYVPFAVNGVFHDIRVETRVVLTNMGNRTRSATLLFIPANTDGALLDRRALPRVRVEPASVVVLDGVVPEGDIGMLEVTGAPQIAVTSELVRVDGEGRTTLGQVPAILAEDPFLPDQLPDAIEFLVFHAPVDFGAEIALVGLVNLDPSPAARSCFLGVFKDEPDPRGLVGRGLLVPGSSLVLQDVETMFEEVAGVPTPAPTGRGRGSCVGSGPLFAYAVVLGKDRASVRYAPPPRTLAEGF